MEVLIGAIIFMAFVACFALLFGSSKPEHHVREPGEGSPAFVLLIAIVMIILFGIMMLFAGGK